MPNANNLRLIPPSDRLKSEAFVFVTTIVVISFNIPTDATIAVAVRRAIILLASLSFLPEIHRCDSRSPAPPVTCELQRRTTLGRRRQES
ncbi:hypothetical protein ACLOJK_013955 [Asimina triloba]